MGQGEPLTESVRLLSGGELISRVGSALKVFGASAGEKALQTSRLLLEV